MGRYNWPRAERQEGGGDNPGKRLRFVRQIRTDFDPDGARAASVKPPTRPRPPGVVGPFAPPSERAHLWQPLGPHVILHSYYYGHPRLAGRVNMLAVHRDGLRVDAASANGGVWYSNDGGVTWKSLGGFAVTKKGEIVRPAQRHACGSIAVRFGEDTSAAIKDGETKDVVFIGTGETTHPRTGQPGLSLGGIGVLVADHPATSGEDNPWTREAKNLLGEGVCRIALQPAPGTGVVAATTKGLFERPSPGENNEWTPIAGTPFNTLTAKCSDVLWTKGEGNRPERLWVWVEDGSSFGLWYRDAGQTNFKPVTTSGSLANRAVLAAAEPPDQMFVFHNRGDIPEPRLYRVACASSADPVATVVKSVPHVLTDQGFYDIALAVHPTNKDRVVVGGSLFNTVAPDGMKLTGEAAVFIADIAPGASATFGQPSLPKTMIGVGVHTDVHDLVFSNSGNRLWLACDGGVFRSDNPTKQAGFFAVNDGLSISEVNFIANHPNCEGYVVAGLQDNGVIGRLSNGAWMTEFDGDGGGIAFHPLRPDKYVHQYVNGDWRASDRTIKALPFEKETAAFYSQPAYIAHHRSGVPPAAADIGQLIVGTSRVWYSEDFGKTWCTLPTGKKPPPGDTSAQDNFGEPIRACRWQSPDVAWILGDSTLTRYVRAANSDSGKGPGTWTVDDIPLTAGKPKKKNPPPTDAPIRQAAVWTDVAVNLDPPPGPGQPPVPHGLRGAVYLGTIGNPDNENVDTLWWFDGEASWYATKLRKDSDGVPAPVTAIVCDPQHPDEVWVGTTVGVWHGQRTLHGSNPPTWEWKSRVNGLPEAAVEDLAIFNDGSGLRLLRAGIASRGVWELRLDVVDVADLTYIRAHDDDLRLRIKAVEKGRDGVTLRSWHGSPDVRPRVAPVEVPPPANLASWMRESKAIHTEALRRFQSALRARTGDRRVRATGEWDPYFNEVLRDLGAPTVAKQVRLNANFWNLSMQAHSMAEAWETSVPSDADLRELTGKLEEGVLKKASCALPKGPLKVEVVVHRRGLEPIDGANVGVTLLQWIDPKTTKAAKWDDVGTWFGDDVPWTAAVNQVLNSGDGKTALAVGDGWSFVLGTNTQSHRVRLDGQTLDPMHAGIASFDLNIANPRINQLVLLVAIIRSGPGDINLSAAKLHDLALTSTNVAVRSIRLNPKP